MGAIRPLYHYLQLKKKYGERQFTRLCEGIDQARIMRARDRPRPSWGDFCFAPSMITAAMHRIVTGQSLAPVHATNEEIWQAQTLTAFTTWRVGMGVYRFHPQVFDDIWQTELDQELPVEAFFRLPEWCPYIEIPEGVLPWQRELRGFFAYLDDMFGLDPQHTGARLPTLVIVLDLARGLEEVPLLMRLEHSTLLECFRHSEAELRPELNRSEAESDYLARRIFQPLVSVLLYLCSMNAEISGAAGRAAPVAPRKPAQNRHYPIVGEPRPWQVAWRLGAALERAREREAREVQAAAGETEGGTHSRAPMRPHLRRAHWHSYWIGKRDAPENREKVVHWLPPIPVNVDADDPLVPTVHPVQVGPQQVG